MRVDAGVAVRVNTRVSLGADAGVAVRVNTRGSLRANARVVVRVNTRGSVRANARVVVRVNNAGVDVGAEARVDVGANTGVVVCTADRLGPLIANVDPLMAPSACRTPHSYQSKLTPRIRA